MFENLDIFKTASGLARHAVQRQEIVAKNIANADTPQYAAKDIASFAETFSANASNTNLRMTRAGHMLSDSDAQPTPGIFETTGATSPNGNSVSLETEMMKASQIRHEHDLALSVYKSSLNILRSAIGRR